MTREEANFIGGMNMCDEISNEAYKKIMCHCEEQEPIIDKIRAEIKARLCDVVSDYTDGYRTAIQGDLAIIDKYKAETEEI